KVPALVIQDHLFSIVDLMSIDNNITLGSLTEDSGQAYHRKTFRTDQIPEYASRSNAWKLVLVSHKDQPRSRNQGTQQSMHQMDIHHRNLIDDHHIRLQRIGCVPLEMYIDGIVI